LESGVGGREVAWLEAIAVAAKKSKICNEEYGRVNPKTTTILHSNNDKKKDTTKKSCCSPKHTGIACPSCQKRHNMLVVATQKNEITLVGMPFLKLICELPWIFH
jgi:hypothetical protein